MRGEQFKVKNLGSGSGISRAERCSVRPWRSEPEADERLGAFPCHAQAHHRPVEDKGQDCAEVPLIVGVRRAVGVGSGPINLPAAA